MNDIVTTAPTHGNPAPSPATGAATGTVTPLHNQDTNPASTTIASGAVDIDLVRRQASEDSTYTESPDEIRAPGSTLSAGQTTTQVTESAPEQEPPAEAAMGEGAPLDSMISAIGPIHRIANQTANAGIATAAIFSMQSASWFSKIPLLGPVAHKVPYLGQALTIVAGVGEAVADPDHVRGACRGAGGAALACAGMAAGTAVGSWVGGAAIGGAFGSVIPVAGTLIGAVVGGGLAWAGWKFGKPIGEWVGKHLGIVGGKVLNAGVDWEVGDAKGKSKAHATEPASRTQSDGASTPAPQDTPRQSLTGPVSTGNGVNPEVQTTGLTRADPIRLRMLAVGERIYLGELRKQFPQESDEELKNRARSETFDEPTRQATEAAIRIMRRRLNLEEDGGANIDFRTALNRGGAAQSLEGSGQHSMGAVRPETRESSGADPTPPKGKLSTVDESAIANAVGEVQQYLSSHMSPEPILIKFAKSHGLAGMNELNERLKADGRTVIEQMAQQHDILPESIAKCATRLYGGRYQSDAVIEAVQLYRSLDGHTSGHERKRMQTIMQENHGFYGSMTATADAFTDLLGHEWADKFDNFKKQNPTEAQSKYAFFRYVLGKHKDVLSEPQLNAYLGDKVSRVED